MIPFTFNLERPDQPAMMRVRNFEAESVATTYARQLLADWPEATLVEVIRDGALIDRLRQNQPAANSPR